MVHRRTYLEMLASGGLSGLMGYLRATSERTPTAQRIDAPKTRATELVAETGGSHDRFGDSVTIDGDTILAGAPNAKRRNGLEVGAAYLFERTRDGWRQETKLTSEGGDPRGHFGDAVALDGDTALIGAPDDTDATGYMGGEAFVFERVGDRWRQQAILSYTSEDPKDEFGRSVALDDDIALVGAPDDTEPNGYRSGSTYVFERSGTDWVRQTKLVPTDSSQGHFFGDAMDLDGDTALIGAPYAGEGFPGQGWVYLFDRSGGGWSQRAKFTLEEGESNDRIGMSAALDGERALVGAPGSSDSNGGSAAGVAALFERTGDGWRRTTTLDADEVDENDRFGAAVALDGDIALVGAYLDEDPNGPFTGAAYVFERNDQDWSLRTGLAADDGKKWDGFGESVALDGTVAVVGADWAENPEVNSGGSAYVFDLDAGISEESNETGEWHGAHDPDADGLYEDVNGDGDVAPGDATVLFENVFEGDTTVTENVSRFDFNDDGRVTPADATVLFDETF